MTQLQVAYGNALIAARGFGAPETTEAFARARQSAFSEQDAPERLAADFGLWAASYSRGDLASMRAHSADFLADMAGRPDSPEAGVAHRVQGPQAAPAEEAFRTAIAVAKRQATRSFELRAALSLAKLYCSMGRNADAHSVLGSALVGFVPTPDFPEVEEPVARLPSVPASARSWSEQARRISNGRFPNCGIHR